MQLGRLFLSCKMEFRSQTAHRDLNPLAMEFVAAARNCGPSRWLQPIGPTPLNRWFHRVVTNRGRSLNFPSESWATPTADPLWDNTTGWLLFLRNNNLVISSTHHPPHVGVDGVADESNVPVCINELGTAWMHTACSGSVTPLFSAIGAGH